MTDVILRKAEEADMSRFIEIEKVAESRIYSAMTTEKEWQEELARKDAKIYAIIKGGEIVGDVSYEIKNKNTVYISGLCVDKKFQGQGIGREAIKILLGLEELKNAKRIELVTHPENKNAIRIYESFGFKKEKQIENFYGDGQPRILMTFKMPS